MKKWSAFKDTSDIIEICGVQPFCKKGWFFRIRKTCNIIWVMLSQHDITIWMKINEYCWVFWPFIKSTFLFRTHWFCTYHALIWDFRKSPNRVFSQFSHTVKSTTYKHKEATKTWFLGFWTVSVKRDASLFSLLSNPLFSTLQPNEPSFTCFT